MAKTPLVCDELKILLPELLRFKFGVGAPEETNPGTGKLSFITLIFCLRIGS